LNLLRLAYRIFVDPFGAFSSLRNETGYRGSMTFLLVFGWVTAVMSGALSLYGVDYSNPSNAGGSAQIFAPWVIENYASSLQGAARAAAFAVLVMVGYIILATLSILVLALVGWVMKGRNGPLSVRLSGASKAVLYGMTPGFLFGWVPNPFYLVGLWTTLWQALAIKKMFDFGWVKTIVVVLCWILIIGVIHDAASYMWMEIW
jgi:hypothetical protein